MSDISRPIAPKSPEVRTAGDGTFTDDYAWMKNKDSEDTKTFVAAENAYCQHVMKPLESTRRELFDELRSRIQETDMSVPVRSHGYWYFSRTQEGQQYAIQCRIPVTDEDDWDVPVIDENDEPGSLSGEEIVFDGNAEAKGHDFFRIGGMSMSADGRWLLYGIDTTGDERYDLHVRDLHSGHDLPETIPQVSAGGIITPDGSWVFYATVDDAWRPDAVWRHRVGTPSTADVRVWHEDDERFWVGVGLSFDERHVVIGTSSKTTSEVLLLPVQTPEGDFVPFIPRREGIEYDVGFSCFEGAGDEGPDIPIAVVCHNVSNPNFQINIIDMRSHGAPYALDEGTCIAEGSRFGCERGGEFRDQPLDSPDRNPENPRILQGARGLNIESLDIHEHFITLGYRANGLAHLAVITKRQAIQDYLAKIPWNFKEILPEPDGRSHKASTDGSDSPENPDKALFSIGTAGNPSYEAPRLRYSFTSFTNPAELHELDPNEGTDRLLKKARVLGDFQSDDYAECQVWVQARDGARVPVSLLWKKGLVPALDAFGHQGMTEEVLTDIEASPSWNSTETRPANDAPEVAGQGLPAASPMFITGYGAYEISSDPSFSVSRLSLLDRGVLYALPHVRGGGEMGRAWYEQGRRLNKKHTFEDFIDATAALQRAGFADPARTVANGGSAGGLLMGAIANMAPQLYAGIEADVPFVDALTSILDPSLPLTVTEWDEWGDPLHDDKVYHYMESYSPYENVLSVAERQRRFGTVHFPQIFITTSMNDTRVLYVEPLKWAARLSEAEVGAKVCAKIEVEAGHGGTTGRYKQWEELCLEVAWCLSLMGCAPKISM
ncbi:S9 family peptidase [Bifidobacterium sp.]|uniref:S9 family peptidase n=1 Tax=Bifidobacterium sp. TaxID=41200 RepID=UPI0039E9B001